MGFRERNISEPLEKSRSDLDFSQNLFHDFIYTLIERTAGYGRQLVSILSRVRGRHVRVDGLLTLPGFDDGEVICAHRMLQNVEAQIAFVLAALFC